MKTIDRKTIWIAATALVVGLLIGLLAFGKESTDSQQHEQHDAVETEEATIWTCSMHPQIRQDEPGDCPICGMDLIPLEDDQNKDSDPAAIKMSPTAMQLANISTAIVGKSDPVKNIRLNGKIDADERLVYSQSSHIPGRIERLMVNFTGELVTKGQTIAYLYSPELVTAQEELFEARKMAESQPQLFLSAKEKLKNWKLSDNMIEEILASGKPENEFPVKADVSGYVTAKLNKTGDYVKQGEAIYEISDLSRVWVLFDVYESDLAWVEEGDIVEFGVASLPGKSFSGKIDWLDPVIDPKTRVAQARVEYRNPRGDLKPEMFATGIVQAKLEEKANSLVIPKTAVMWTGTRSLVYVKNTSEQGVDFVMREVTLGPSLEDSYLIEEGLSEGEEIAVNGTFSIDAAAQLAGKPSMMNPAEEVSDQGTTISAEARQALQPMYDAYLAWKDELTNDNFEKAQQKATEMSESLSKISMSLFTGDTHNTWMDYQTRLNEGLQHVQHFNDIEQLRKAFQTVSATMIAMTKSFTPLDRIIYVQHCPMADNNKGADWLSTEKNIRNPYFGSSMLTCGEVTSTIPPAASNG